MRLWSIHPKYLDVKGLLAVWREGLLAKSVLEGKTKGYANHPQLIRFRKSGNAIKAINAYLYQIYLEAARRGYKFNRSKIALARKIKIPLNDGQLKYEFSHLMKKLRARDRRRYLQLKKVKHIQANPIFKLRRGGIEDWERL